MSTPAQKIKAEIEATALHLGLEPGTVSKRAGMDGHYYARLCKGARAWPETAEKLCKRLAEMRASGHGLDSGTPLTASQSPERAKSEGAA